MNVVEKKIKSLSFVEQTKPRNVKKSSTPIDCVYLLTRRAREMFVSSGVSISELGVFYYDMGR